MDTFNLHVENYLFAKFRNIWPKTIFHKDSAGSFNELYEIWIRERKREKYKIEKKKKGVYLSESD